MREIKFRGKRVGTDTWVHGYFFRTWEQVYILHGTTNVVPNITEVIPETVGQFTGLHDKNGKEIYEKDMIAFVYCPNTLNNRFVGEVGLDKFNNRCLIVDKNILNVLGYSNGNEFHIENAIMGEVIGTIHDNL
jgi:uncharacterized phage protein (TIGR01671 family)